MYLFMQKYNKSKLSKKPLLNKILECLPLKKALLCTSGIGIILLFVQFLSNGKTTLSVKGFENVRIQRVYNQANLDVDTPAEQYSKCVKIGFYGRTGNLMFAYAAMIGIAERNSRTPTFPDNHYLRRMFHITVEPYKNVQVKFLKEFTELHPYSYDARFENLDATEVDMVELYGYFHSWKYFDHVRDKIRKEFTFQEEIARLAEEAVSSAVAEVFGLGTQRSDVTLVGVHVRRNDMASNESLDQGYTVAPIEYIRRAIKFYEKKFQQNKLLFVVISDDELWCKENITPSMAPLYVLDHVSGSTALAALAACNHSVITVGSFGWWGAWLAGGMTLYYKKFPRPNSPLSQNFAPQDYFYPGWIGLG